jgi:hypothetical protein
MRSKRQQGDDESSDEEDFGIRKKARRLWPADSLHSGRRGEYVLRAGEVRKVKSKK